ncbi:MAG: hypothetical protein Q9182_007619, partial [Xanthomendoza sp. 2 TL-2023]
PSVVKVRLDSMVKARLDSVVKGPGLLTREADEMTAGTMPVVPLDSGAETETGTETVGERVVERAARDGKTSVVMLIISVVVQVFATLWQLFSQWDEVFGHRRSMRTSSFLDLLRVLRAQKRG